MSTDKQDATASLLGLSLDHLVLTIRAYNVLLNAGIQTVGDLVSRTADELLRLHHFGKASLFDVMQTLALHGLQLSGPQYSLPAAWCKIARRRLRLQPIRVARRNRANGRPAPPSIDPAVRASLAGKRLTDDAAVLRSPGYGSPATRSGKSGSVCATPAAQSRPARQSGS